MISSTESHAVSKREEEYDAILLIVYKIKTRIGSNLIQDP